MNILKKLGYIKKSELSESEVIELVESYFGNPMEAEVSPQLDAEFFKDLSKIDTAIEYFKNTAGKDISRYFAAKDKSEQDIVRGGFLRTAYILKKLKKQKEQNLQD